METSPGYKITGAERFADLATKPCTKPFADPEYEPPTPEEVDGLIKIAGWSQNDVAKLVGVSFDPKKGSITIRRWRMPSTAREHREIPYSAWRLMLLHAGIVGITPAPV